MTEYARLLLLLALTGAALTLLGGAAIWFNEEERRLRRAFRRVLGAQPQALAVAKGRGRAVGFCFSRGVMAVAWDTGAWCLVYRIDELIGAELVIDGEVVGRAYRGEQRRLLDQVAPDAQQVTLRLVFDDAQHPDFELELWRAGDETRRGGATSGEAVQEANRWLARTEAILRRPQARRPGPAAPAAAPPPAARPGAAGATTAGLAAAGLAVAPDNDEEEDEEADFDDLEDFRDVADDPPF